MQKTMITVLVWIISLGNWVYCHLLEDFVDVYTSIATHSFEHAENGDLSTRLDYSTRKLSILSLAARIIDGNDVIRQKLMNDSSKMNFNTHDSFQPWTSWKTSTTVTLADVYISISITLWIMVNMMNSVLVWIFSTRKWRILSFAWRHVVGNDVIGHKLLNDSDKVNFNTHWDISPEHYGKRRLQSLLPMSTLL